MSLRIYLTNRPAEYNALPVFVCIVEPLRIRLWQCRTANDRLSGKGRVTPCDFTIMLASSSAILMRQAPYDKTGFFDLAQLDSRAFVDTG